MIKSGKSSTVTRVGIANPKTGNDGIISVNLVPYMKMRKSLGGQGFGKAGERREFWGHSYKLD